MMIFKANPDKYITNFLRLAQGSRWGYIIRDCQQRNPMKNPLIFTSKMIFLANPTNFASQTSGSPIFAVQTCCPFSERNLAATFFTKNASLISLNGEHRQQTKHLIGRHVWIDRQKDIKLERLIWNIYPVGTMTDSAFIISDVAQKLGTVIW